MNDSYSINFFEEDVSFSLPNEKDIIIWIGKIVSEYGSEIAEINFIFCSDDALLELNRTHLEHDYYTDILTFPYHQASSKQLHSDIYISVDRVGENANQLNIPFQDELHRVMIHGVLHLLGHDDHEEESKIAMKRAEDNALAKRSFV